MTKRSLLVNLMQMSRMLKCSVREVREKLEEDFYNDNCCWSAYADMDFPEFVNAKRYDLAGSLGYVQYF